MSLILGTWQYYDIAATASILEEMYGGVKTLPHETHKLLAEGQTGFGCARTYNTPEALYENSPVFIQEYQLLFAAQGRIDNRAQLAAQMGIGNQKPDGALMLQAYLKWGKDCVHHLRGDWSFAVFDYKEQELFIAKDPMGCTAIYYYHDDNGFYFGSSIKSLLNLPGFSKQLNELHFIRNLTLWNYDQTKHDTYFKNVFCLPNAHVLTVKDRKIRIQNYWTPGSTDLRHYKNKQDYTEELNSLLNDAISARLRSYKPVAGMLSGGLDSSTISYMAAALLKPLHTPLTTFSHVPLFKTELLHDKENEKRVLDETPFIMEIVRASGNINPIFLNSSAYSVVNSLRESIDIYDCPVHGGGNVFWALDIYRTAQQKGFSALLSAEGGNGNISFAGTDYLLPFRFNTLMRHPYRFFKKQVAKPIAIKYFNRLFNKRFGATANLEKYVLNIFVQPDILKKYQITEDIKAGNKTIFNYISDVREQKERFIELYKPRSIIGAALTNHFGIEMRDPTADTDLIEYFFSIPNEIFFDDHYNNRMLVKRMMKDKLPDTVLFAKRKGLQSADLAYRVKAQANEMTDAIHTVAKNSAVRHYINISGMLATWQQYLKQPYMSPYEAQRLLKPLNFALFLHKHFD